jgi:hypothetical protein
MTKLYVAEYAGLTPVTSHNGIPAQCPQEPALAVQVVDYTAGTAASSAFNAKTRFVRIHCDSSCSVKFGGTSVTAAVTDPRMAADQTEFRGLPLDGSVTKVAAITNT